MVARPGPRRSSCNAGELMRDMIGRPDVKQYYSGGLRYAHICLLYTSDAADD